MKKYLLSIIISILGIQAGKAGHEVGGIIISYEYVTPITGTAHQYVLSAYSVFYNSGLSPGPNVQVNYESSCFIDGTFTLPKVSSQSGGLLPIPASNCSYSGTIASQYGIALYRDTVTLPGTCADFVFWVNGGSGRYYTTSNLGSSSGAAYFAAHLNNTFGGNSSVYVPAQHLLELACVNNAKQLYHFLESDGDSVNFYLSSPQQLLSSNITDIPYAGGYSVANQIGAANGNFNLDPSTGVLTTAVPMVADYLITIGYTEYRFDVNSLQWQSIGSSRISLRLLSTNCTPAPVNLMHQDTAAFSHHLKCSDSLLTIAGSSKLIQSSITTNGSEFKINSQQHGSISINRAKLISDSIVQLELSQPFSFNDTLSLTIDNGSDGNTILSACGGEIQPNQDTLVFLVNRSIPITPIISLTTDKDTLWVDAGATIGATSFEWDFGDGSTATGPYAEHIYTTSGTYNVQLIVKNNCGSSDTIVNQVAIVVCDTPIALANIMASNDTLFFDGTNSSAALYFEWFFDDGDTSHASSGIHVYDTSGTYNGMLVIKNKCNETDTVYFSVTIEICEPPLAAWTFTVLGTTGAGMRIQFDGSTSSNATSYFWDFGDGNTDNTSLTPIHTYTTPGLNYIVSLKVTNACGKNDTKTSSLSQVGLREKDLISNISIMPNPASDYLSVSWSSSGSEPLDILIYDVKGRLIYDKSISETEMQLRKLEIDTKKFLDGIYQLHLKTPRSAHSQRILIIH